MPRVQSRPVQEQLPGEVLALAASEGLGELRASFLPKRAGVWAVIGMVFFSLLGLLVFVLPGLFFVWRLLQTPNFNRKQAAKRIHCFDHGLIVSDRDRPVAFRWDSASVLQQITRRYANGVYVGTSYLYTLFKPDGSTIELTGFYADPEVWGAAIQHEITRAQLPRALDLVGRGETVRFGDVAVNAHGMATAKRGSLPWSAVERVEVKNGVVFVGRSGKLLAWSNTPVHKVPNFFVFLAVVDRLRG
ncbi:hypothetical protein Slala03_31270 [Streptomyces lavendulae subsp. lavendulae]|uniref:DUF6585 family protein n=1 Tax=Streptomyces lavendulae TaxID=1914 RepID=UPI0024A27424|nr:DUF6585 family protein [Streptomyces lavendulae]GLV83438.1 hypothetical protein Slala03_31270 [Streptomyces lavendulae subsp. lavendulae]